MSLTGLGLVYRRSPWFRTGYRILTYHGIQDNPQNSFAVKTDHFRTHMAFLSDHYRVIGMGELVRALSSGPPPEPGSVAVTFDDGYSEVSGVVREILLQYAIPATFYVITGTLDRGQHASSEKYLSWNDARDMIKAGFSIGSHGVTHRSLGGLSPQEVHEELHLSRVRIQQELGVPPDGFSFPYGTLRDFTSEMAEEAGTLGYQYAVTAVHGLNHMGSNPFLLRRTTITAGDGLRTFRMILKGYLDPWYLVDRWGYAFQRTSEM
jgi:peptidoglycan/xylan/chitin deacetylase (PgdA/CDA1 family)